MGEGDIMKARLLSNTTEHFIELEAETLEEASAITKFGINSIKTVNYKNVHCYKDGTFIMHLSIGTRKEQSSRIAHIGL